jgi:hypothetical protein
MVNFVIVDDATRHVCEVQVVHEMMLTARKGLPGHAIYGIVRSAMELIESCGRERELRREAVRSMVKAGATDVELIGASEDAWILEDPEWVAGVVGGRDGLGKGALTADKEEGRVCGLGLREKWKGEALPASVARLTALRELTMRDCTSLKSVAVLPASVMQIGEGAFYGCTSLASITLPASVTQIGGYAFKGCTSLSSITIPSATLVDPSAFGEHTQVTFMALELIGASEDAWILEDPEWVAGVVGGRDGLDRALSADKEEGRVVGLELSGRWKGEALPASVARLTALREVKMRDCTSLKSVAVLPASVTQIGEGAFYGCASLASITLPASVTQIGGRAFRGCTSLSSITLPESVTQIGGGAFRGCASLASITLPASVTQIGEGAFNGCTSLASITVPASVMQIGEWAFRDCASLASITVPESVTQIGGGAFRDCTSLASITIPESVTQIGVYAFEGCTSLLSITIPSSTVVHPGTFSARTQVTRA